MTRKHCKRKVWSTAINPIQHAIEGAAITSEALLNQLRARELAAVEACRTGSATLQEWADPVRNAQHLRNHGARRDWPRSVGGLRAGRT